MNAKVARELAELIRQFGRFIAMVTENYADELEAQVAEADSKIVAPKRRPVRKRT